ncbi:major head protein [Caulobacter phage CcrBL9]|uniref:Major capsid protein n=1 Tax=Caulobacter phage CcrBL9 TaxID=2283270 RepID=A0A385EE96_9CAUD|nr:major head protein [Caulobacter phage CcrBL9]AXQ69147.1 major capsid protein [Caulobacter phage CcrBL9]
MAALTLLQAAEMANGRDEVKRGAIIELFAEPDLLRVLPFMNVTGSAYSYIQEGQLPGVAFRGINESYTTTTGVVNPQTERLRIAGGDLDVDKSLIKTHGADVRGTQEAMKVKALALYLAGKIVNGDSEADPREFDGLRKRIVGDQLIPAGASSGGDALSLTVLDTAIDQVDGATHIIMSKKMRNRLNAASRQTGVAGFITWDKNEFGTRIAFYNDLPILVTDYDDKNQQVIAFNEANPGGGATVGTSIYVVNISEAGVVGLQNGVMDVTDLGEVQDKPVLRTRVEWLISLAVLNGRAAARIWGIKDAAVVA